VVVEVDNIQTEEEDQEALVVAAELKEVVHLRVLEEVEMQEVFLRLKEIQEHLETIQMQEISQEQVEAEVAQQQQVAQDHLEL
jgi:glycine betaine/choline ABC-type transport system substrate-binding protein